MPIMNLKKDMNKPLTLADTNLTNIAVIAKNTVESINVNSPFSLFFMIFDKKRFYLKLSKTFL